MSQFDPMSVISAIKRYPYMVTFGETVISPLAQAPQIESEHRFYESMIYENGGQEAVASMLISNRAKIILHTKDITTALNLLSDFCCSQDVFAPAKSNILKFTPIGSSNGESLLFANAFLHPQYSYVPTMGGDHVAKLVFIALPDNENKRVFSFQSIN